MAIRAVQREARQCYVDSLKVGKLEEEVKEEKQKGKGKEAMKDKDSVNLVELTQGQRCET